MYYLFSKSEDMRFAIQQRRKEKSERGRAQQKQPRTKTALLKSPRKKSEIA